MVITRLCKYTFHRSKKITILSCPYSIDNQIKNTFANRYIKHTQKEFFSYLRKSANTKNASHATR